ncbi:MAG: DegV family protein [Anaerolineae bacterium]|nr:MAG: DegV family protein [Anaerolineae bacterium]
MGAMSKVKVAIVTDSTVNLPVDVIKENNIYVIPQILNWEGKSYLDQIDITTEEFYQRLPQSSDLPKTSQPAPGQFTEHFQKVAEGAESIVAIFVSELLSGTIQSAHLGAEALGDYPIEIVDSRSVSLGLGLLVTAAARYAAEGHDYKEVAAYVRNLAPRLRVMFVVDTLEYLHKGGRIGGAKRLVGSVLSIKPVLHLEDGKIEPFASIRTKNKAIQHMLDVVLGEMKGKQNIHAGVIHARAPQDAEYIVEQVRATVDPVEMFVNELTPVIGANVGPGVVGMGYYVGE